MSKPKLDIFELCFNCTKSIITGHGITLGIAAGERWPKGFPRGELLSVGADGIRNVSFDPLRVLAWVQKQVKATQSNIERQA